MQGLDRTIALGWLVPGLIGIFAGVISAAATYYFQRRRDRAAIRRADQQRLREELLRGLSDPVASIRAIGVLKDRLRREDDRSRIRPDATVAVLPLLERLEQ